MDEEKLLLAEYQVFSDAYWKNEESGERRVNFFISITTGVIGAVIALMSSGVLISQEITRQITTMALIGLSILGFLTFLRMMQRDYVTDEYKGILRYLREQMRRRSTSLDEYNLPYRPSQRWWLKGGLAITTSAINSLIVAITITLNISTPWILLGAVSSFLVSFAFHLLVVRTRTLKKEPPSQTFRAGVGAIILNEKGEVLAFERKDLPNNWQLPQGGMYIGEAPIDAIFREIREETGISPKELKKNSVPPILLAYDLPKTKQNSKTGRGQVHYWFLFKFVGTDNSITLGDKKEFVNWAWLPMNQLISKIVPFKKNVYQELETYISKHKEELTKPSERDL